MCVFEENWLSNKKKHVWAKRKNKVFFRFLTAHLAQSNKSGFVFTGLGNTPILSNH